MVWGAGSRPAHPAPARVARACTPAFACAEEREARAWRRGIAARPVGCQAGRASIGPPCETPVAFRKAMQSILCIVQGKLACFAFYRGVEKILGGEEGEGGGEEGEGEGDAHAHR